MDEPFFRGFFCIESILHRLTIPGIALLGKEPSPSSTYLLGAGESQVVQLPHPHLARAVPQEQALSIPGKQHRAEIPFRAGSTGEHGLEAATQELMSLSAEKLHISLSVL